jgi:hypothetical protein
MVPVRPHGDNPVKTHVTLTTPTSRFLQIRLYGSPFENSRTPDYVAVTRPGLIYTDGSKLAEYGGFAHDDRNCRVAGRTSGATVSHFQR